MINFGNSFNGTFIRNFAALLLLFTLAFPLYAESATTEYAPLNDNKSYTGLETVTVDLSSLGAGENAHYAFLYGYQAMLQGKCKGALLTFDENMEYITGFLTPDAPDDFCTRLSSTTLAVAEPVMADTMSYMYELLGDRASLSILMNRENKAYNAVILFEPDENAVITPMWYSDAENRVKEVAVASGINPEEVYLYLSEDGLDKDTALALVASDKSKADELVLSALKLKKEAKRNASVSPFEAFGITDNLFYIALAVLAAAGAGVLVIFMLTKLFVHNPENPDYTENPEKEENHD